MGANQLYLSAGGVTYPCCLLPGDLPLPAREREAYLSYGSGHEPTVARVWMTEAQYLSLTANIRNGVDAVSLTMSGQANAYPADGTQSLGERTLTTAACLYVIHARIARLGVNTVLREVLLVSAQYWWKWIRVNRVYNLLGAGRKMFIAGAASATSPTTYANILAALATDVGASWGAMPSTPAWNPHNLVLRRAPADRAVGQLLAEAGMHLVFNPWTAAYSIVAFDRTDTTETTDLDNLGPVTVEGANGTYESATAAGFVPAQITVAFPKYPAPEPSGATDTVYDRWTTYDVSAPVGMGKSGTSEILYDGGHWDVASPGYTQDLSAIATGRANAVYARLGIDHQGRVLAGGYPILVGKTIRRVRLSMDLDGWYTTVVQHGLAEDRDDWVPDLTRLPDGMDCGSPYGAEAVPTAAGGVDPQPSRKFLAKITGNASLATRSVNIGGAGSVTIDIRWKYAWSEVRRDGDGVAVLTGGRSGTTGSGYAINLLEINHADVAWGVDMTGTSYPVGFRPRPVGGGGADGDHKQDIVVEMEELVDINGDLKYQFSAMGSHDGSCT